MKFVRPQHNCAFNDRKSTKYQKFSGISIPRSHLQISSRPAQTSHIKWNYWPHSLYGPFYVQKTCYCHGGSISMDRAHCHRRNDDESRAEWREFQIRTKHCVSVRMIGRMLPFQLRPFYLKKAAIRSPIFVMGNQEQIYYLQTTTIIIIRIIMIPHPSPSPVCKSSNLPSKL